MLERAVLATMLVLGGCAVPRPDVLAGPDPSDPAAPYRKAAGQSVTAGNSVTFPVATGDRAARDWAAANRRVAPGAERAP